MPKIPTFQRQFRTPDLTIRPEVNVAAGAEGRALSRVGEAIGKIGDLVHKREVQKDVVNSKTSKAKIDNALDKELEVSFNRREIDEQKIMNLFDENVNKQSQELQTNQGRDHFLANSKLSRVDLQKKIALAKSRLEGMQAVEKYQEKENANAELVFRNPLLYAKKLDESKGEAQEDADIFGRPDIAPRLMKESADLYARQAVLGYLDKEKVGSADKFIDQLGNEVDSRTKQRLRSIVNQHKRSALSRENKVDKLRGKNNYQYILEKDKGRADAKPPAILFPKNMGDIGQVKALQKSIANRNAWRALKSERHGFHPDQIPIFTDKEAEVFLEAFERDDISNKTATLRMYDMNLPNEEKALLGDQLFAKNNVIGLSLMIAQEAPDDVAKILAGDAFLKPDVSGKGAKTVARISTTDLRSSFNSYVKGAIPDGAVNVAYMNTALAHMVKESLDRGEGVPETLDKSHYENSLKKILGPITKVNDWTIASFRDDKGQFVDGDDLADIMEELDPEILRKSQGGNFPMAQGGEIDLSKAASDIQYTTSADGRYLMSFKGEQLLGKKGEHYEIDMREYYKEWQKKRKTQKDRAERIMSTVSPKFGL